MPRNYLARLKVKPLLNFKEQKGQSIIIMAFIFLGLIAMLGLALDLGLVYIERVRVSRTTDAATLASVVELPFEEEAMRRAIEYIELNGYKVGQDTEVRVRGCIDLGSKLGNVDQGAFPLNPGDAIPSSPADMLAGYTYLPFGGWTNPEPPRAIFVIDTLAYQPVDRSGSSTTTNSESCNGTSGSASSLYGTSNKIRVSGQVTVDMNFMQFFGFGQVPVSDQATAENVTNLDVAVVFDISGSMNFETNCFGCWNKVSSRDIIQYPFPLNGDHNPLDFGGNDIFWTSSGSAGHDICRKDPEPYIENKSGNNYHYFVHEAEFYSADVPIHGWEFDKRQAGQGFWVLQRTNRGSNKAYIRPHPYTVYSQSNTGNYPQLQGAAYNSECFDASKNYECWRTTAAPLGEKAPSNVPWVEYDFTPDWDGDTYIWIRAQGGSAYSYAWNGASPSSLPSWRQSIYWQVDLDGDGNFDPANESVGGGPMPSGFLNGDYTAANESNWRWARLGKVTTGDANHQHTLRLYQGSAGFNVDKIIFTNDPYDASPVVTRLPNLNLNSLGDDGPDATPGSGTREACNMCNPAFGQLVEEADCSCRKSPSDSTVVLYPAGGTGAGCTSVVTQTNQLTNDLFHDIDPIRSAQEAVKNFARRLDPKHDQLGLVPFTDYVRAPRVKLQCIRYAQTNLGSAAKCFDPTTNPISYTNVIRGVEEAKPTSSTDIAEGMREGLEELGVEVPGYNTGIDSTCTTLSALNTGKADDGDKHSCDRQGAARRVLVLMTDGSPNANVSCPSSYKWRGAFGADKDAYDCAMYFASQAADNNVTVYTIGIGSGVNIELLTAMATGTDPNPPTGDTGFYFEGKGGKYYPAAKPSDLDAIFNDILDQIFVRIVG